jgi:membrane protease YdiL (CAAX protease family)
MNQADAELSPLASAFVLLVAVASLTAFITWIRRWWLQGYVLAYKPRRRLPWGLAAGLLALLMTLMGVANAIAMRGGSVAEGGFTPDEFAAGQFRMSLLQIGFAAAIVAVLVTMGGASLRDLGWPESLAQLGADIRLGVWIALASMMPLYLVQAAAMLLLDIPPAHPLLDQMVSTPNAWVFVSVMFAAVVAAPLFEELVFRLLLQGGLERWEDERVAWPLSYNRSQPRLELATPQPDDETSDEGYRMAPGGEVLDHHVPEDYTPVEPGGRGVVGGLGHGWGPILASSFLFAIAHLGNGPSPIALFLFAIFLGYAYQRTHRILPSMVAHLVLNFVSVTVMILSMSANGE